MRLFVIYIWSMTDVLHHRHGGPFKNGHQMYQLTRGDQELRTRNNAVGIEPAQRVRKNTPPTETWRQAHGVALLKPGKDPSSPKNFRPISLLCHLYKLYERLILNRLSPIIEHVLIPEQAGFRPGKSCRGDRG